MIAPPKAPTVQGGSRPFYVLPETAYTRAMTAPRMGGQHPHDGRHIMSMRHWGMVGCRTV